MRRTNKKGFTIVELVIVIAVIAILAAVLIPTFASLVKKANVSKDTQLIKNLNTALAADTDGHNTMTDALNAAAEFGYDVAKINASATGNEILWDSVNDVFCYYDSDAKSIKYISDVKTESVADYQYWQITDKVPETQTYSIYYTGETPYEGTVTVGFDAGTTNGCKVTFKTNEAIEVTIRTTYMSTLTIDAENATVHHYGEAEESIVTAVASNSYHEYGKVGYLEINKGRAVAESGANIFFLYAKSGTKVDKNNGEIQQGYSEGEVTGSAGLTTAPEGTSVDNLKETAKQNYNAAVIMNGTYYATISAALNKVSAQYGEGYDVVADTTIILQRDVVEYGIKVAEGVTFTLDFNGYTWDIDGTVGSTNTTTNGMQLLKGAKVTLKNGTLKTTVSKNLIQNYSDLTIDNMVIDARESSECNNAVSNNDGNIVISNSTIYASAGQLAFDVWSFGPYTGANVTIKDGSVVNGNIEVGLGEDANTDNLALKLESCTFNGNWTSVDNTLAEKVSKKADLNIAAPDGYKWGDAKDGYQTLVKAD